MPHLTQVEFNTIREMLGPTVAGQAKYDTYAQQAQDQQLKQLFQQMSDGCSQKVNTFMRLM